MRASRRFIPCHQDFFKADFDYPILVLGSKQTNFRNSAPRISRADPRLWHYLSAYKLLPLTKTPGWGHLLTRSCISGRKNLKDRLFGRWKASHFFREILRVLEREELSPLGYQNPGALKTRRQPDAIGFGRYLRAAQDFQVDFRESRCDWCRCLMATW